MISDPTKKNQRGAGLSPPKGGRKWNWRGVAALAVLAGLLSGGAAKKKAPEWAKPKPPEPPAPPAASDVARLQAAGAKRMRKEVIRQRNYDRCITMKHAYIRLYSWGAPR